MNGLTQRLAQMSGDERWRLLVLICETEPDVVVRILERERDGHRAVPVVQGEVIESRYHDQQVPPRTRPGGTGGTPAGTPGTGGGTQ